MKDCEQCGINKWNWHCERGMMQGTCSNCGLTTNKFKANGKHRTLDGKEPARIDGYAIKNDLDKPNAWAIARTA